MSNIYALFVGINKYHPQSGVSNLAGCVNDIQAFQAFVQKNYKNVKPKVLLNEEATRTNIIQAFSSHLIKKAKKGDTILFYYAGHGSYSETATPFKKYDPKGQDESFVCYDSRLPGHYDLTDKEVAVLLSRIKQGVHTVIIADSCHSASINRDASANFNLARKRFTGARSGERSLSSYLLEGDNFYQEQLETKKELSIPYSKHILLSACDRNEEAWETNERRGLFSTTLLDILQTNRNLSYGDLFERVRHLVFNVAKNQKPTISPQEGFNPNTVFLESKTLPNRNRHLIKFEENQWVLDFGGIHGLPTDEQGVEQLCIGIYEDLQKGDAYLFQGCVSKVLLGKSILDIDAKSLDQTKTYWGEIETSPSVLLVNLRGRSKQVKDFEKKYQKIASSASATSSTSFLQFIKKKAAAKYSLLVYATKLKIIHAETGKLIHEKKGTDQASIEHIIQQLAKINEWEKIAHLQNSQAGKAIKEAIEVTFFEESDDGKLTAKDGKPIMLDYWKQGSDRTSDGNIKPIWYQIKAKNKGNKSLYVALLHLNASFGITSHFHSQEIAGKSQEFTLDKDHGLVIQDSTDNQATDIFKVIISTIPFDDHKYQQEDIAKEVTRSVIKRKRTTTKDDWYTQTIIVNTIRKQNKVGSRSVHLPSEGVSIAPHPTFKADLAFQPIHTPTSRSLQPNRGLAGVFQSKGIALLNLSTTTTRSSKQQDKSIIELSGIENTADLKKQPLELTIHQTLKRNEQIIPVTMKNGYILPFGESKKNKKGETIISINEFPETDASPATVGKRSLGKSLWFGLLKMTGNRARAFRLRKVVYDDKGKVKRNYINLLPSINKSKKILLVIHGIIGDTKPMLKNLEFLLKDKHYDLILSFDYENLNEPIEEIAATLNKRLKRYGLGANDGKQLDILAHSMGGLVSRYLIEQIREGDNLVDQLFMFGTPNGGSIFGDIPAYRDTLVKLLTVALNFGKAWLGPVGAFMEGVNKTLIASKALTVTLKQMSPSGPFIEGLYKNKINGHTQYTVIAGDTTKYKNKVDSQLAKFMENLVLKIGNVANKNTPNDIAVLVDQIKAIPKELQPTEYDICCHHMNYFEEGEGLMTLRKVIASKKGKKE